MALSPKISQLEAEQCAWDLLKDMGVVSLPVLPIDIAKRKDILVKPFSADRPGIAGCLMMVGNQFGIGYANHLDNEGFVNFTVGHELGHFHLPGHMEFLFQHGNTTHFSAAAFTSSDPHEKQADAFSASLMMPERMFLPELRRAGAGLKAVKKLAALCTTSLSATAIRYGQLAEDPAAIIVTRDDQIEYAVLSPTLREIVDGGKLKRGDLLPIASATYRFNRDYENVIRSEEVESVSSLREWFPDAPDHEMNEDVIGLGKYNKTLTVLFTQGEIETEDEEEPASDWRPRGR